MCDDDAHHHLLAASSEQENRAIANIFPAARALCSPDDHGLRRRGEYPRVGSVHSRMDFIPH
jgi:hypothetical protein